ncbi:MAG: glutamate-5-semialdehyde dehydrogenase [Clostridiales bacterium]|nr:glutamate-5-semialdehyde dehydrogenase [Clostridiales bacterium]
MLSTASTLLKNKALSMAADALVKDSEIILNANKLDMEKAKDNNISEVMQDRLKLTKPRIEGMADGLKQLAALPDPVGEIIDGSRRPNGLEITKKRVPFGVVGIIYESRPNVTADAAGICLKSGNVCILRGGKEAINSNLAIAGIISREIANAGLPADCVQILENTSREIASEFMKLNKYIDVLIPRGGAGLINSVLENATMPVIQTGTGNCHIYADESADLEMALKIIINAKVQKPSVCNAVETVLINEKIADSFLPELCAELVKNKVEIRGCEEVRRIFPAAVPATEEDWATEYNDLILAIKVVKSLQEAIDHINKYSTQHSEAIITKDYANALKFQDNVDAACVYVNASTRFTDGEEFGLGAEIGISNQKLHARGPMGLREMTTIKYTINGSGQIK